MNTSLLVIGIILLAIAGLSWIIYIPIFSDFWIGEVGGLFLLYKAFTSNGKSQQSESSAATFDSGQE